MSHELYKKYRPKKLEDLVGQAATVKVVEGWLKNNKLPHTIMLHGPSGCGKTTIARILRRHLRAGPSDYHEVNCADFRGIDTVRDIGQRISLAPLGGGSRVWLIDEAHKLTNDAQNAFLKMLEDTPDHVYFFLCTTEPGKLITAVHTRASKVSVALLKPKDAQGLLRRVCKDEEIKLSDEVGDKIVEVAQGSPRALLVLLGQIAELEDEEQQLQILERTEDKQPAIMLARALAEPKPAWPKVSKVLKDVAEEDPESLRRMVLAWCKTVMLANPKLAARCYSIINEFERNLYDSGMPGLVARCYAIVADPG